jgi:hypothetical protein
MPLVKTQILKRLVAFLRWVDSISPKLANLGCIRQPKWSPVAIVNKLAILGLRESE